MFNTIKTLRLNNQIISLDKAIIMAILNATNDSFFDGSRVNIDSVVATAGQMLTDGATILDFGGYSTRPGHQEISVQQELERVLPAIEAVKSAFPNAFISVDSFRADVAKAAIAAGACMINDVGFGGLFDADMINTVASLNVAYVLMHNRGNADSSTTMHANTHYAYPVADVLSSLLLKLEEIQGMGVSEVIVDPGIGFSKTSQHNYQIINALDIFMALEAPLMMGISRKGFLAKTIGKSAKDALQATTAAHMVCLQKGTKILRVHDVAAAADCIAVHQSLLANSYNF